MSLSDEWGFQWDAPQPMERDRRHIEFEIVPEKDEVLSLEAGRPVHKDVEFVHIANPGSRDRHTEKVKTFLKRNPQDEYVRMRYERWKNAENRNVIQGTPLKELPFLTRSEIADFHVQNIYSAEQLANLPDSAKHRFHNINTIVEKVKAYLQLAQDTALATKQAAELQVQKDEIEFLKKQVAELSNTIGSLKAKK